MPYTDGILEIFLNLVWLVLSVASIAAWIRAVRQGRSQARWNTIVAIGLLLLLLFPVISITDDIVAMSAPAEIEHAFRRGEAPTADATPILALGNCALLQFVIFGVLCLIVIGRVAPLGFLARIRAEFLRAAGVRPPPSLCAI